MRDPFAKKRSLSFTYADSCVVPRAQALADGTDTINLMDEYGLTVEDVEGVWLQLRVPNTKGDQSAFAEIAQSTVVLGEEGVATRQRVRTASRDAFLQVVESWAFDRPPSGEAYMALDLWVSEWVDSCVASAWRDARGTVEKKDAGVPTPESTPSSEPEALESPVAV